jgi:hypothetical protein
MDCNAVNIPHLSLRYLPSDGNSFVLLRPHFSLIHSEFNEFLFAPIGDDENDMPLSVLSALTRLDLDPWDEAKRLSILPRGIAATALAPMIARLPGGQWQLSDAQKIAERLIALLPQGGDRATIPRTGHEAADSPNFRAALWWICLFLTAATLAAITVNQPLLTGRIDTPVAASSPPSR